MKKRGKKTHKGENGKVLVIGGSEKYAGAVYLAASAIAALRCGSDLVTVVSPEKVAWTINSLSPDIITFKLPGKNITSNHLKSILELVKANDVFLIGNGVGRESGTARLVCKISEGSEKKKVIDGDALRFVNFRKVSHAIFTPHEQEFSAMLKNSRVNEEDFSDYLGDNIILLKGVVDKIYTKGGVRKNISGNEGMTVGGTGDVLAGLAAGLLSQGYSLEKASYLAAKLNGRVGDRLKKKLGYGFIASDFLEEIAIEAKRMKII